MLTTLIVAEDRPPERERAREDQRQQCQQPQHRFQRRGPSQNNKAIDQRRSADGQC